MGNPKKNFDHDRPKRAHPWFKIRLAIAILATLCPVVCYISRQNLSMAIVAMVDETQTTNDSPQPQQNNLTSDQLVELLKQDQRDDLVKNNQENQNSCPRPNNQRRPQDSESNDHIHPSTPSHQNQSKKFDWSSSEQSLVLGAFFWTYVIFQIPAARFAEQIGAKWVLATATIGSSVLSLASPWAASFSVYGLFLIRALMGICQTALYPACYVLYSHWLPPLERSQALPILCVGAYLGSIVASTSTGFFIQSPRLGWEYAFYMPGIICAIWSVFWVLIGASEPREHASISLEEIEYIESKMELQRSTSKGDCRQINDEQVVSKKQISWTKLFTSKQVWAMIAAFFASSWSFSIILLLLPTYLNDILHLEPFENGMINSTIYILYCVASPIVGSVSTMMVETRLFGISRLNVRKLFQGIALFGVSLCFILLPVVGCDTRQVMALLFIQIILFSFINGGEVQLPNELSADFSGTIYAIGNCIGSSTGFIVPAVRSFIIDDTFDRSQWATFFYVGASISSFGALLFVIFGRNDLKDYSREHNSSSKPTTIRFNIGCCRNKNKFDLEKSNRLHNGDLDCSRLPTSSIPSTTCHCSPCKSWISRAVNVEQGAAGLTMTTQW